MLDRLRPIFVIGCLLMPICGCSRAESEGPSPAAATAASGKPVPSGRASADAAAPRTLGEPRRGEATWYRATGEGNCSFEASDDLMVAALNTKDYANAALCGGFIRVAGPRGEVVVRIVDRCPGCKPGGLDLSREAFTRIAEPGAGRVPVTWQVVEGPVSGPVTYHYMDGTTRYWLAVQLRNLRWPVAKLEIMPRGAAGWSEVKRRRYNYFVRPKPIPAGPVRVRVTALTGATLEDVLPEPKGGRLLDGAAQFP